MAAMTRKEAREEAFRLLFETEFRMAEEPDAIYALSTDNREVAENAYIKAVYFGVREHLEEIDAIISENAKGWKLNRISATSGAILRLAIYEMLYTDIPFVVAINEAVELAKKYDHDKAPKFINGILNAVAEQKGLKAPKTAPAPEATAEEAPKTEEGTNE